MTRMDEFDVIRRPSDLRGRSITSFPLRLEPSEALLCEPTHFDVVDIKNPHMEGNTGKIDKDLARRQWEGLRETIAHLGYKVRLIAPGAGLEDMVFTANQSLPGKDPHGQNIVLLSNMKHASRQREVEFFEKWYKEREYKVFRLSNPKWIFEGQGDGIWHPGRQLMWGGFGFRSVPDVYDEISKIFSTTVVLIELRKEHFYHLDTCFCPLSEKEVLFFPDAFTPDGKEMIHALFEDVIEVSAREAKEGFACNALVLGKNVLIEKGNDQTCKELMRRDYVPVELDTSEFKKSGGSVFCMKMMVYPTKRNS